MEFSRHGIELPITNKVLHEIDHVNMQFFEFFSRVIIPDRLNYIYLQVRPRQLLTCAGAQLVHEGVVDHLKRLFAPRIFQAISLGEKFDSSILELN